MSNIYWNERTSKPCYEVEVDLSLHGGDRGHPGWRTMAELEHVIQKIDTK